MPRTGGRVGRVLAVLSQAAGLGPSGLTASAASAAGAQWIVLDPVGLITWWILQSIALQDPFPTK